MCYDNTNHRVVEGEGNLGKMIGGNRRSIESNIEKKVGTTIEVHGRESTKAHNSKWITG